MILRSDPVYAQNLPITVDGTTNTQIDAAANGVPIVNIAAPNSGGLSHNKFTNYNVNSQGLIINNAANNTSGVVSTQIGGIITDNPNLSASASVILNEVTSSNVTQINGYTEIAGSKADLIIANPNGISMSGAGFINVSRLTTIVGSANQTSPNPSNLTFSLSQATDDFLPELTISGTGIDLEEVDSTDLVASLMNIVAPIYAGDNEVSLRTGDDSFNYLTKEVTSDNTTPGSNTPDELAIDASSLAKIQAGNIYFVATKEGFGIKYSADLLASRSGVIIDSQGNIEYANIEADIGDIDITSQNEIVQNGISQTNSTSGDINIYAEGDITNYGQFLSAQDITIETNASFLNESSELNLSDNDFTINAIDFTNEGIISASNDLSITAINLTNSQNLVAGSELTLTADQITNSNSISSDTNIVINANIIDNNTSNSSIQALNDIDLNVITLDNSSGEVEAGNDLTLRNFTLNTPDIADLFSITSQITQITNSSGTFLTGNNLDFDLGTSSDYTIIGTLESSGDIIISANNITNQTNLTANNDITITANDTFTNGSLNGDNTDIKIVSGNDLSITSENLFSNYSTISSENDLTLISTSANINNNADAEIIGGSGTTTLEVLNGTLNQDSTNSLVSNGDLIVDVYNLSNDGRIDVLGDLTVNAANDLTNETGALIYSGNDMTLNVINDLTNNSGAVIYAENNLIIQKRGLDNADYDADNNQINLLENISAEITSYAGTMSISAETIDNERSALRSQVTRTGSRYCGYYVNGCWWYYPTYYSVSTAALVSASTIFSEGDLTINVGSLTNNSSNIFTNGDLELNVSGSFTNTAPSFKVGTYTRRLNDNGWQSSIDSTSTSKPYSVFIKASGDITGTSAGKVNNSTVIEYGGTETVTEESPDLTDPESAVNTGLVDIDLDSYFEGPDNQGIFTRSTDPNSPLFETRSEFINQSSFFGSDYFYEKIGLDLDDVQTEFEQQNKRLVGDQFFQNKIISAELRVISKDSFLLSTNETNTNNEIGSLLDNAADEYTRLGLTTNEALTQTQIDSLEKDIVWFETQTIDGELYIVPKIYLSQATRDKIKTNDSLADTANIYAGGDLNLVSTNGSITNSGSIIANNVTITAENDVTNKNFSNITATSGDLDITSNSGSVINFSKLKASEAISITAADDVINSATVITNDADLLASGNDAYISNGSEASATTWKKRIRSSVFETASIESGSLTINAGNDFTNQAADITTTGDVSITAGNDASFKTLELHDRTELSWGHTSNGGSLTLDTVTNVGSDINIGGNLEVTTSGLASLSDTDGGSNINIYGSDISTDGDLSLTAKDYINISSVSDAYYKEETSTKTSSSYKTDSIHVNNNSTNSSSNLDSGGDLSITSGNDTYVMASNLTGDGSASLLAGSYVDLDSTSETYGQTITNNDAQVNILNGTDSFYSYSKVTKVKTAMNLQNLAVAAVAVTGAVFTGGASLALLAASSTMVGVGVVAAAGGVETNTMTTTLGSTREEIIKSNLSFGGNLSIASASDLVIKSSDLSTNTGDINLSSSNGDIFIISDSEDNSSYQHGSTDGSFGSNKKRTADTSTVTNIASIITAGSDSDSADGNITISSAGDSTLKASTLSANKNITITAEGDLNLLVAQDSSSTSYTNSDETTFNFTKGSSGFYNSTVINNKITAGANGDSDSSISLNIGTNILAQYNSASGKLASESTQGQNDTILDRSFIETPELAYLNQLDSNQTTYQSIDNIASTWDQTGRGLTETGTAVVAVVAVAATVATLGAAAPITAGLAVGGWAAAGAAATVAVASTAAATVATSSTNASMNADGNLLGSLDDIGKTTLKDATSDDALRSYAIAGLTAAALSGISEYANIAEMSKAANAASTIDGTRTAAQIIQNAKISFIQSAISNTTSSVVQSSISGDSTSLTLKSLATNIAIGAVTNFAATEIGNLAHPTDKFGNKFDPVISKPTQYTLHAALGCAGGAAGGGDCASGAVSGVVGEIIGENLRSSVESGDMSKQAAIQLAGLGGGFSSIITGEVSGQSDSEVAQNIWSGQRIGANAAENNALLNVLGAVAGGTIGAVGSGVSAVMGGEEDIGNIAKAALIGGGIGAVSGAMLNPTGVVRGIQIGSSVGAFGGGVEGFMTEYYSNPDATSYDLANNTIKGAISGAVGGAVAGAFGGKIGSSAGIAGNYTSGMMGLGAGISASAINTQYDLFEPQLR